MLMLNTTPERSGSWVHPEIFAQYDIRRQLVAPELGEIISETLSQYIPVDSTIVEIGSGNGALRRYAGQLSNQYSWIETEQNPEFLNGSPDSDNQKVAAQLPNLPFHQESVDAVVGFSVLDTLRPTTLKSTAGEVARVVKNGGTFTHILDMAPDYSIEIESAAAEGKFPLVFQPESGDLGMGYNDINNMGKVLAKIESLPTTDSVKRVFMSLLLSPTEALPRLNGTAVLGYLGNMAVENNMMIEKFDNWMELLGARYAEAFGAQGFNIVADEIVVKTGLRPKSLLPHEYWDSTHLDRTQGMLKASSKPDGIITPNYIRVSADAHVFVAQKI